MRGFMLIVFVLLWALPVAAQNAVTEDEVMEVAERMYCPICENEPLDDCRVQTCMDWKAEIRRQLEAGNAPDAIINDFVTRYGQHVVGVPQDPLLQALSFGLPVLALLLALFFGVRTFSRWQDAAPQAPRPQTPTASNDDDETYRNQLERDL